MAKVEYVGSVYIGVVGGDVEIGECRDSQEKIVKQPGDSGPHYNRATKGYEARQAHLNNWINNTNHGFMLLLDHDMIFESFTLERLRAHRLPFVSGYYMRRRYAPIAPVWFELPPRGVFPMEPWTREPERERLHPLGASGWGCMLIHREVVKATKPLLKGENEIIEDDMDVWAYDLATVLSAVRGLRWLSQQEPTGVDWQQAMLPWVETLEREIRPLRGDKNTVIGSDIRYPFYAREAGFILMGDPDVRPAHMLNYPLSPDDFTHLHPEAQKILSKTVKRGTAKERRQLRELINAMRGAR